MKHKNFLRGLAIMDQKTVHEMSCAVAAKNISGKTLLSQKKLLAFLGGFFFFSFMAAVVFPAVVSAAGFWSAFLKVFQNNEIKEEGIPKNEQLNGPFLGAAVVFASAQDIASEEIKNELTAPNLSIVQNSALVSPFNPQGIFSDDIHGSITTYTVKEGDNLSVIARSFGVTVNTLLWANNIKNARLIKPGDTLVILPVAGLKYAVKKGDTIASIAKKFKPKSADLESFTADILSFNGLAIDETLAVGAEIIIPDGELQETLAPSPTERTTSRFAALPEYIGYYLRPILGGRNTRATGANPHGLHGFNAVDLANGCGNIVMASANGMVLLARSSGWNSGYGRYVVIAHPNGTQTLYAHLQSISVAAGQSVLQGEQIGIIGSSGNSTGCHVHFEIRGAQNPF